VSPAGNLSSFDLTVPLGVAMQPGPIRTTILGKNPEYTV
jgi:hypothetical protein